MQARHIPWPQPQWTNRVVESSNESATCVFAGVREHVLGHGVVYLPSAIGSADKVLLAFTLGEEGVQAGRLMRLS